MNKDIKLIDKNIIRKEVFDLFEDARYLYNRFYVYNDGNYDEMDYIEITSTLAHIEDRIIEMRNEMN